MATCVECGAEFDIDEVEVGDIVSCPECGLEMEVLSRRPLELEAVTDEEEEEAPEEEEESSEWE
jgi:alpha-aminoadipate carrier protein LysW